MTLKAGYYPLMDLIIALRQLHHVERFKPYAQSLSSLDSKLSHEDRQRIKQIGDATVGWLSVIENGMTLTFDGLSSAEDLLTHIALNPMSLLGPTATTDDSHWLSQLWINYGFLELARHYKKMMAVLNKLQTYETIEAQIEHLMTLTDRFHLEGDQLVFHIVPEHRIKISDIEGLIVMPSLFASRNVVFWYKDNQLIFFVNMESQERLPTDPSDMLLLSTLAFNDKTRLKMLKMLNRSPMSVNEMAEQLGVNASTASRHFKVFKDVGLVDIQAQDGNSVYYRLVPSAITTALDKIAEYILSEE